MAMKYTVVRKGDRIPTPVYEKDGTMGGFVHRQAACDGISLEGGEGFLTEDQLKDALRMLRRGRK